MINYEETKNWYVGAERETNKRSFCAVMNFLKPCSAQKGSESSDRVAAINCNG